MNRWTTHGRKLTLQEGNIVLLDVDAIVNAANTNLIMGGGVAGAIRNAGGPSIQEECNSIGPINVGEAVITNAGSLKAKHVIHAAGPVQGEGQEDTKLLSATLNSLKIANENKLRDIAFPAISTGIFGFPMQECSEIMIQTAMDFLETHEYPQEVIFCLYGQDAYDIFEKTLDKLAKMKSEA
jgi:O-acetyl-ADP-ribose deacetylase (regulator of RNase III)